jgi:hypothetical protein
MKLSYLLDVARNVILNPELMQQRGILFYNLKNRVKNIRTRDTVVDYFNFLVTANRGRKGGQAVEATWENEGNGSLEKARQ